MSAVDDIRNILAGATVSRTRNRTRLTTAEVSKILQEVAPIVEALESKGNGEPKPRPMWHGFPKGAATITTDEIILPKKSDVLAAWMQAEGITDPTTILGTRAGRVYYYTYPTAQGSHELYLVHEDHLSELSVSE